MATMMKQLGREASVLREKAYYRLLRAGKSVYQLRQWGQPQQRGKTILLIVGCQRSGTTLMNQIFEHDLRAKVYPEVSELSSADVPKQLRLNPMPQVYQQLEREPASLVVLKPLVESQRTPELLNEFEQPRANSPILTAKAIWVYRHYRDVAASYVKKWGTGHSARDLRAILEAQPHNWRSEHLPPEVVATVRDHYSEDMHDHDASALYWYVRNTLFYTRGLERELRVMLCRYEELVKSPVQVLQAIYDFIGYEFPGAHIVARVRSDAQAKGANVILSPAIEQLCQTLLARLDETHAKQSEAMQAEQMLAWGTEL